jgi:peptidoglycan hydrolase-like protein with peptidoglycan-binding domain
MSKQHVPKAAANKAAAVTGEAPRASKAKSDLKAMSFAEGEKALAPEAAKPKAVGAGKKDGLSLGSHGAEVSALQAKLARLSKEAEVDADFKALLDPGKIDGKFGARLEAAIKALQSNNQLPMTGLYDAATAAALDDELSVLDQMRASVE